MKLTEISNIRLLNQQVTCTKLKSFKEIVNWMGALQAQDFPMSKWAIGIRSDNSTDKAIETEINKGEILRTHLLRPTWHLVSAENIHWMLELTAPGIKAGLKSRLRELELTESLINKCSNIIQDSLKGANHLTREELIVILAKHKVLTDNQRGYHILVRAELDGIICSGIIKGGKQTYALLEERVPKTRDLTKEEALKKIAGIYFLSHGPATLPDFKWWSGLSAADARNALESIKPDLVSDKAGTETYWLFNSLPYPKIDYNIVYLLPAFDEFLISYKDRKASIQLADHKKAVSENGIFRPVIVINGQVRGLWKRTIRKEKVIIETKLFKPVNKSLKKEIEKGIEHYGLFLDKKVETKHFIW
jgi:hypothetical protein